MKLRWLFLSPNRHRLESDAVMRCRINRRRRNKNKGNMTKIHDYGLNISDRDLMKCCRDEIEMIAGTERQTYKPPLPPFLSLLSLSTFATRPAYYYSPLRHISLKIQWVAERSRYSQSPYVNSNTFKEVYLRLTSSTNETGASLS